LALAAGALTLCLLAPESTAADTLSGRGWIIHCTIRGDTPASIARRYGVSRASLRASSGRIRRAVAAARRKKKGGKGGWSIRLPRNRRVKVKRPLRVPATRDMFLRLKRGASLAWLARTYRTSADLLRCVNDLGTHITKVRAGRARRAKGKRQRIAWRRSAIVRIPIPARTARPRGSPRKGSLKGAERLPEAPGVYVRSPGQAWGTHHLITGILRSAAAVQRQFADTHPLVVGHLSKRKGGYIAPHKSHQNGLDADLGYYHRGAVPHDRFVVATRRNLDSKRTWALVRGLLDSHGVQYIFINTYLQKALRRYAARARRPTARWCRTWLSKRRRLAKKKRKKRRPATLERCLDTIFQYRRKGSNAGALIRHERGHDDHLHVRFWPAS